MKVTLEFDDKAEAVIALRGSELYSALYEIRELIRRYNKHDGDLKTCIQSVEEYATEALYGLGEL